MSIQIARQFRPSVTHFWATTFGLEVRDFDEFFLPRLGEPPINATILVDFRSFTDYLQNAASSGDGWRFRRVNRHYLAVPMLQGGNAFHPKTYFFANRNEGRFLVGSGNLGLRGLDEGCETFCEFRSDDVEGVPVIGAWRDWMQDLVESVNDSELSIRWANLLAALPWLPAAEPAPAFLDNRRQPLINAIVAGIGVPADELHLMAPFYDSRCQAVAALVDLVKPRRLHVYLNHTTSVDGQSLTTVLNGSGAEVSVRWLEPEEFVHAKLIGIVANGKGRLISGSANLSTPALLNDSSNGNSEVVVLAEVEPGQVSEAFTSSRLSVRDGALSELAQLSLRSDAPHGEYPFRLLRATLDRTGAVSVSVSPEIPLGFGVTDGTISGLLNDSRTGPVFSEDPIGPVWIIGAAHQQVSNVIALQVPHELQAALTVRTERVPGISGVDPMDLDSSPMGAILRKLDDECRFDFDEGSADWKLATESATETEAESKEFWERLEQEVLHRDPRYERYRSFSLARYEEDDIFHLLALMRDKVPTESIFRVLGRPVEQGEQAESLPGHTWSVNAKRDLRIYNVLDRWCGAVRDPRGLLLDPTAPIRNFVYLLLALADCWRGVYSQPDQYLSRERVERLSLKLLSAVCGDDKHPGVLEQLPEDGQQRARSVLGQRDAAPLGGALAYLSLSSAGGNLVDRVFAWQPVLRRAVAKGGVALDGASIFVSALTGQVVDDTTVQERLVWSMEYTDDEHWANAAKTDLDLPTVEITKMGLAPGFGISLIVAGIRDPFREHRLVSLIVRALDYKNTSGVFVDIAGWGRLAIREGEPISALVGKADFQGATKVTRLILDELALAGGDLSSLLEVPEQLAAG